MKLTVNNIAKPNRLTVRSIDLPAPPPEALIDRQPTKEEIDYSVIVEKFPIVEKLVRRLGLVSTLTNEPIKRVIVPADYESKKIKEVAQRVADPERSYSREEILERIKQETKVDQERAERGLALMIEAGAIEQSSGLYYLSGSTPF